MNQIGRRLTVGSFQNLGMECFPCSIGLNDLKPNTLDLIRQGLLSVNDEHIMPAAEVPAV